MRHPTFPVLCGLYLALGAGVSACGLAKSNATTGSGQGTQQPGADALTIRLRLAFPAYKAQAVVNRHTRSDIEHVVVDVLAIRRDTPVLNWIFEPVRDPGGNAIRADVPRGGLDKDLVFSGLAGKAQFRFTALAYKAPGENTSDLISTADSFVDFGVGIMGQIGNPSYPRLPLFLTPTPFSAGTGGQPIQIEGGERITFDPPDIYVPEPAQTNPPGTVIVEPLTEEIASQEWAWGDEEYGDE